MIKAGGNFKYRVKFVKKSRTEHGSRTTFNIGDKIRNAPATQYQNYSVTVWQDIDLKDGDSVKIKSIESIASTWYNNKVYHNLVCDVEVESGASYEEEDESYSPPPPPTPKTAPKPSTEPYEDVDTTLPFDI